MAYRTERHDRGTKTAGFTLVEVMIVVALIGVLSALGAPLLDGFFANLRLQGAARDTADLLRLARIEAIRTGQPHIVFFSAALAGDPPATDPVGAALPADPSTGGVVPMAMLQDDNGSCTIDAGEAIQSVSSRTGVAWGTSVSGGVAAPGDTGPADHSAGSSFHTPAGATTTWVRFGADGVPVGFSVGAGCAPGGVGSGGGAIYLTNGQRDYAVVLTPLGGVRVHAWNVGAGAWTN
jgi:prepilin-type N-terminal cleavage/methylation domain-containing protein